MKKHHIYTLLCACILPINFLNAGILFVNHFFVEELIAKDKIKIRERAILHELKQKLAHNHRYIQEHDDLLENYVRLYQKHNKGELAIGFLLATQDGREQYKEHFIDLAPFIAKIMQKKRSRRSHLHNPLALRVLPQDFEDEFFEVPRE